MTTPKVDNNDNYIRNETTNATNNASKLDLGGLIELGAGYEFINKLELFSSITYNKSLTTFSNANHFSDANMRHYGFSLAIGLKYKLKGK